MCCRRAPRALTMPAWAPGWKQRLLPLAWRWRPAEQTESVLAAAWEVLDAPGRFLLVKLFGGGFRVGVSKLLVQRALAEHAGLDAKLHGTAPGGLDGCAQRRRVRRTFWRACCRTARQTTGRTHDGQPYPFFLAHALQAPLAEFDAVLGPPQDWLVEWKYDGIRAQVVKRAGQVWVWSRGEELITERFPRRWSPAGRRLARGHGGGR